MGKQCVQAKIFIIFRVGSGEERSLSFMMTISWERVTDTTLRKFFHIISRLKILNFEIPDKRLECLTDIDQKIWSRSRNWTTSAPSCPETYSFNTEVYFWSQWFVCSPFSYWNQVGGIPTRITFTFSDLIILEVQHFLFSLKV